MGYPVVSCDRRSLFSNHFMGFYGTRVFVNKSHQLRPQNGASQVSSVLTWYPFGLRFLYSDHVGYSLHRDAVFALLNISPEVRIFPLLTLMLERSPYLDPLMNELTNAGYHVSIERTEYEFQKGGNEMLVVRCPE